MKIRTIILFFIILFFIIQPSSADSLNIDGGNNQHVKILSNDLSKDNAFEFSYNGTNISFVPKSIYLQSDTKNDTKAVSVASQTLNNVFKMDNMFGENTSYTLTQEGNIVKEELTLISNPYPLATDSDTLVFKHRFNYSGLAPYMNDIAWDETPVSTSGKILFKDTGNKVIFSFIEPYVIDASGNTSLLSYDLSKNHQTGEMNIKLNIPMHFLNSSKYPVIIDPSIEQNGGSITISGTQSYDNVNITNGGVLYISAYNGSVDSGYLILNVSNRIIVDSTSSINGDKKGYTGGYAGSNDGGQVGVGCTGGTNGTGTSAFGGGGAGGNVNIGGTGGGAVNQPSFGGTGCSAKGNTTDKRANRGTGGGGGGDTTQSFSSGKTNGEAGGAMLTVNSVSANLSGTITVDGGGGGIGDSVSETFTGNGGGGGGGGAGGDVLLNVTGALNISGIRVTSQGGIGGIGGTGRNGGFNGFSGSNGSRGMVKFFYGILENQSVLIDAGSIYYENTNTAPTVPVLITHANYHNSGNTTVTWNSSADSQGDPITYDVTVGTTSGGTDILNYAGDTDTTSNSFTATPQNSYYWSVRACDSKCSAWATESNFAFTNTAPAYSGVILSPSAPTDAQNLTASYNYSDADGDTITNHTRWYKSGVLQTALNDTLTVLASGNISNGETWYFKVYGNDSYDTGIEYTSNEVIIGSSNVAPAFTNLSVTANKKYNKNFWINASGISDDSSTWQAQAYIYNSSVKEYLGNSSWTNQSGINYTVTNPWTSGTKTIYVVIYDSGNGIGQQNLSSAERTATFVVNTTAPIVTSSSLSATSITIGQGVTIEATFDGLGANISTVIVQIERPDATTANWTMTCGEGETPTCTKLYTSTSDVGTYYIRNFYLTDDSDISGTVTSDLSFNAATVVSSSPSSGSGSTVIIKETNATQIPQILFKNITDTRNSQDIQAISDCLDDGLMLSSQCSTGVISVITNPFNIYVVLGAYIGSFLVLFGLAVVEQRPRKWAIDTAAYGSIAWIFVLSLSVLGFNMFIVNYIFGSSNPGFMTLSFATWSILITIAGDHFSYTTRLSKALTESGRSQSWVWNK